MMPSSELNFPHSRIGLAPSVSSHVNVVPAASAAIGRPIVEQSVTFASNSVAKSVNHPYMNPAPPAPTESSSDGGNFNTAPAGGVGYGRNVDEFGARPRGQSIDQRTNPQIQTIGGSQTGGWDSNNTGARPRSSGGRAAAPAANRLTVTNYHNDMPEEVRAAQLAARSHARNTSVSSGRPNTASTTHRTGFMTAEEEKKVLYERAKAKVEEVQGVVRTKSPPLEVCPARTSITNRILIMFLPRFTLQSQYATTGLYSSTDPAEVQANPQALHGPLLKKKRLDSSLPLKTLSAKHKVERLLSLLGMNLSQVRHLPRQVQPYTLRPWRLWAVMLPQANPQPLLHNRLGRLRRAIPLLRKRRLRSVDTTKQKRPSTAIKMQHLVLFQKARLLHHTHPVPIRSRTTLFILRVRQQSAVH